MVYLFDPKNENKYVRHVLFSTFLLKEWKQIRTNISKVKPHREIFYEITDEITITEIMIDFAIKSFCFDNVIKEQIVGTQME